MANITVRQSSGNTEPRLSGVTVKNAPLTNIELDNNFNNLNNDVNSRAYKANAEFVSANVSGTLTVSKSSSFEDLSSNTVKFPRKLSSLHRSPNAITAMFVYDTSKDSDGGAWTEKCQHTSWYNETIYGKWLGAFASESAARTAGGTTNDYFQLTTDGKFYALNAGSGVTRIYRGNKRSFPKVAAIVIGGTQTDVAIYDLTEPGRPMWMNIPFTTISGILNVLPSYTATSIIAINGEMMMGSNTTGFVRLNFPLDKSTIHDITTNSGVWKKNIASRAESDGGVYVNAALALPNSTVRAVAATILPDAPTVPITGLKVPTIALAGDSSITVFHNNGTKVTSANTSSFTKVTLTPKLLSAARADNTWYYAKNPGSLGASFALSTKTANTALDFNSGTTRLLKNKNRSYYIRTSNNMINIVKNNESTVSKGIAAKITNTYNTGWMHGDIKRVYFANTTSGNVSSTIITDVSYKNANANVVGVLITSPVAANCSLVAYSGF